MRSRAADVFEARFFGGLTIAEAAASLGASEMTVRRDTDFATAWLTDAMRKAG